MRTEGCDAVFGPILIFTTVIDGTYNYRFLKDS